MSHTRDMLKIMEDTQLQGIVELEGTIPLSLPHIILKFVSINRQDLYLLYLPLLIPLNPKPFTPQDVQNLRAGDLQIE